MKQIPKKITGYTVLSAQNSTFKQGDVIAPDALENLTQANGNVVIVEPPAKKRLERGEVLHGSTYKIKPNTLQHGFYVTINNTNVDNILLPYEVFITTKNTDFFVFMQTLSLTLTTAFRWQQDISHLLEEYADIGEPNGGYWGKRKDGNANAKGKFYKSVLGEIADVIQAHLDMLVAQTSALEIQDGIYARMKALHVRQQEEEELVCEPLAVTIDNVDMSAIIASHQPKTPLVASGQKCPSCSEQILHMMDGCMTCTSCGHSKCG